jgi:hypothetical protein
MVLRGHDTGSLLFDNIYNVLRGTAHTVTNLAFSVALSLGFRNIYLFGVDLGVYEDLHHAKDSVYYENKDFSKNLKYPNTVEGYDGKMLRTNGVLLLAKRSFEENIAFYKETYVYNCSLGAKIEGAYPLHPGDLHLKSFDKSASLASILSQFEENFFTLETINTLYARYEKVFFQFRVLVRYFNYIYSKINKVEDIYRLTNRFYERFRKRRSKVAAADILFLATLFHQLSYLLLTLYGIKEEKRAEYFKKGLALIREYLCECEEKLRELLKN